MNIFQAAGNFRRGGAERAESRKNAARHLGEFLKSMKSDEKSDE